MPGNGYAKIVLRVFIAAGFLFSCSDFARGQEVRSAAASSAPAMPAPVAASEGRSLAELIYNLQAQVETLNSQLADLRNEQRRASEETRDLRHELELVRSQGAPGSSDPLHPYSHPAQEAVAGQPAARMVPANAQSQSTEDRVSRLEEDQQVLEGKINDQYQTKVESGSKYRLRLSGIALLNLYENRGTVDNQDYPGLAESEQSQEPNASSGAFGGTLRQTQIRLQAFGPDVAGAHTSADVNLDFGGGFPNAPNGSWMGLVRMRTAIVRFDWANTSIVAGQDSLFFAPLAPTSLATIAQPALSYAGNLWGWTPQVRVEHRVVLSETSSLSFQGGILDSLTADVPPDQFERYPSWGEESGQPGFAARVSWSRHMFGQDLTLGAGGYYGRQDWGFGRKLDGWTGTLDLTVPLGKQFEFTGAFYRGKAVAGFGGGVGQGILLDGSFINPLTTFRGLNSIGGWAQLKFKMRSNFEINGALGIDNPFAHELRRYNTNSVYPVTITRNLSPLVNFIYQIRSDILFSTEYRFLKTSALDTGSVSASHINLSLGYIF